MLMPLPDLIARHRMRISGVVHAGAHTGEEAPIYERCGIERVLWIEADHDLMETLNENVYPLGHVTACACLGARDGDEVTFHIAEGAGGRDRGQSSSVLPLGTTTQVHPGVRYVAERRMRTRRLAPLVEESWAWPEHADFLNLDLQGYELECLRGAEPMLEGIRWIYAEINEDALYEGCALLPDLARWLGDRGFRLVEKKLYGAQERSERDIPWFGWGDALFARTGPET
jgi:FkbM family methyltransferase